MREREREKEKERERERDGGRESRKRRGDHVLVNNTVLMAYKQRGIIGFHESIYA